MRHRVFVVYVLLAGLAGCAAQPERVVATASGKAEGVFRNASAEVVSNHLVGVCAASPGVNVAAAAPSRVECRGPLTGGEAMLTQMLIGNSYSTPPEGILQFSIVEQGDDVRVYGEYAVETIMAFGQPRRVPITNNNVHNQITDLLWRAGAERPA